MQAWNFLRHFLEMCIAMCVGVALTTALISAASLSGPGSVRETWPWLSLVAIAILITLPMVAWMRFRGMAWRPIGEMSLAGIAAVIATAIVGVISATAVTPGTVCGIACVAMLGAMALRLDLYTGRHAHHMA